MHHLQAVVDNQNARCTVLHGLLIRLKARWVCAPAPRWCCCAVAVSRCCCYTTMLEHALLKQPAN